MKHTADNPWLSISVSEHGAELKSLVRKSDQQQLLWQADPKYWNGQSPILFPTVGRVANDVVRHKGTTYPMPKHGLVKDMDFHLEHHDATSLTLGVDSTEDTLKHYPFPFHLSVSYRLEDKQLVVSFIITNHGHEPMPFHLGAHPALNLPQFCETDTVHGYLGFDVRERLVSNGLRPGGYLWPEGSFPVMLDEHGLMALTNGTFLCDTILDSRDLARACTLYNKYRDPIATVRFDSPVLALWAPCGGRAPFVCIEPWWGCCDETEFNGDIAQRPWTNTVGPEETKTLSYSITVL